MSAADAGKRTAALACAKEVVRSGQRIGVGSGTTIKYFIEYLRDELAKGALKDIVCVPTSSLTRQLLQEARIPVVSLETHPELDVAVDGADEMDSAFNLIKGGGGCLTQEKVVQSCAKYFYVIADQSKLSEQLGTSFGYLPIEVVPFAYKPVQLRIQDLFGGHCKPRMASRKCGFVITDNMNYILDWHFPRPPAALDWQEVDQKLHSLPGVVETGLFHGCVERAYFGDADGQVIVKQP